MNVSINRLKFSYEDFRLECSLKINEGEFISILGPSGSGKTTLLRLLAGFQQAESGEILFGSRNMNGVPPSERNIGMVFQDYALFPHMNVFRNIAYGLKYRKMTAEATGNGDPGSKVRELLSMVSLEGYENRSVDGLSGGEKQRVALARALAPNPGLMLFDEPLSALDVKLRKGLRREIRRIQQEIGFTAVYVTHDQEEAMSVSDRIAVMNGGCIIQTGSPEEIYNSPVSMFTADFIGVMNRVRVGEAELTFRPESCTVAEQPSAVPDNKAVIRAKAVTSEFGGGYYICEAAAEGGEVVTFYSARRLGPGEDVILMINREDLIDCC